MQHDAANVAHWALRQMKWRDEDGLNISLLFNATHLIEFLSADKIRAPKFYTSLTGKESKLRSVLTHRQ